MLRGHEVPAEQASDTFEDAPSTEATRPPLIAADLFAGAGGFSLGAIEAGFEIRAAVEQYGHAVATYKRMIRNKTDRSIEIFDEDILALNPHEVMDEAGLVEGQCDLLLGGPPCQGFSSHRLGKAGVDDPRNALLLRYFAFVRAIQPRMFLLENVPGMLHDKHADYLREFLSAAEKHGYTLLGPTILNARDYGVPQNRRRVFIVGYDASRVAFDAEWPPSRSHGDPEKLDLYGTLEPWRTSSDAFADEPLPDDENDNHMNHNAELTAVFESTPINGGSREQSNRVLKCHETHGGHKDVYGRIDPDRPSPTMTTACINPSKGRFVHPTEPHGITARQAARLQTFPDDFVFEGGLMAAGMQIGNAVPVRLAEVLCRYLADVLRASDPARSEAD